jgi:hypothetical protein
MIFETCKSHAAHADIAVFWTTTLLCALAALL